MTGKRLIAYVAICAGLIPATYGWAQESTALYYNIKYISAEHAYIDAGRADSIAVGDTLRVFRDDQDIAEVEVSYVGDNSASCKILYQNIPIEQGDKAALKNPKSIKPQTEAEKPDSVKIEKYEALSPNINAPRPKTSARLHGRVAFQLYRYDDRGPANLDITRPTMRLVLSSDNTGLSNLSFNLNMRTRQDSRSGGYSGDLTRNDWHHRIYEMSIAYGGSDSKYMVRFGRIIANKISGIGYIDGLLLESELAGPTRFGLFAGAQPEWQYAEFRTSLQKYGAYVGYLKEYQKRFRLESTLAFAGEYHKSTISREFLFLRNVLDIGRRTKIYHTLDIDINRRWRREKMGSPLTLSDFLLSIRYQLTQSIYTGFTYDNRKNYWTYDNRSLDEQLFDTNMRQGLRANTDIRLPGFIFINMGLGYRFSHDNDGRTWSFLFGVRRSNLTGQRLYLSLNYAGFNGSVTDGNNLSLKLGKYFRRGGELAVYYGIYEYKYSSTLQSRSSHWLGFTGNFRLISRYYLYADYQYGFGKDIDGQRLTAEIGYRF